MKRWIGYTLGILLTLLVLAAVGGMGYRLGFMRGAALGLSANGRPPETTIPRGFERGFDQRGPNFPDHLRAGLHGPKFEHGRGRMHFFPLSGLVHILVIGLLLWLGYAVFRRSGWQFVRADAPPAPDAPSDAKRPGRKSKS